ATVPLHAGDVLLVLDQLRTRRPALVLAVWHLLRTRDVGEGTHRPAFALSCGIAFLILGQAMATTIRLALTVRDVGVRTRGDTVVCLGRRRDAWQLPEGILRDPQCQPLHEFDGRPCGKPWLLLACACGRPCALVGVPGFGVMVFAEIQNQP